ncbi:MAG: LuxR family transcriptional regulator [Sulfuricellaceae bacterium]|nr:LuxR family transcriptional regulator [Sulfuricellaceae bacterium]
MLSDRDLNVLQRAETEAALFQSLRRLALSLGFDHFMYAAKVKLGGNVFEPTLSGYPPAWLERYRSRNFAKIDPVLRHCETRLTPLVWRPEIFSSAAQQRFFEEARQFGLKSGVSFPVHGSQGEVALLSLSLDSDAPWVQRHIAKRMASGHLLACFAHEAMMRLVVAPAVNSVAPLTEREKECLYWVGAGKNTAEIAQVLHVSEHTVVYHIRNTLHKFGVRSRLQAVLRAAALGVI